MIYLDTHIVAWLYAGLLEKFSQSIRQVLNENEILISPIVRLELGYLYEIQRVVVQPDEIVTDLAGRIGLRVSERDFNPVISRALNITWTRDPFDRLIVAHASLDDSILISKDETIRSHYPHTRW